MAETKEFKAESKRLLEMMINSIYTHKEYLVFSSTENQHQLLPCYQILSKNI